MSEKGIAMVSLIAVISVMLILVSVITVTGINTSNTSKKIAFASELKMLQDCVDSYRTKNDGEFPISDFVTIDLSSASDEVKKQFNGNNEEIINNKVNLRKIDYTKLDLASLSRGISDTEDDIYVVSNKTGIVYYAKGLKIGNNTYYTLTDELRNLTKYNSKSDEVLADEAIIFETSTNSWTNDKVSVKIKVPKEYTSVTVREQDNIISIDNSIDDEKYNIYNFEAIDNCIVNVMYTKKDGTISSADFNITNIDKQNPEITITNISNANTNKKYLEIKGKDFGSGVKIIKYDIDKINNDEIGKIYFSSNGIEVNNNIIEIDNDVPYITLYIEDNSGNYQILIKEI